MKTFVDTSALYALLDADDENADAAAGWLAGSGADPSHPLVTHSYVIVETSALVHHRLGTRAVRDLFEGLVPALQVTFVEPDLHERSTAAYLAGLSRRVSFVDRVSFQLIREAGIDQAFAFDHDFVSEGIPLVPERDGRGTA